MTFDRETTPHDPNSAEGFVGHNKRSPVDLERRRALLRTLAAGLGAAALGTEQLAFGFLQRPEMAAVAGETCTQTSTETMSSTFTYPTDTSMWWTETTDATRTGTSSYTTIQGESGSFSYTFTKTFFKPPQTITVSQTNTYDNDPDHTVTITMTCGLGTVTKSLNGTWTGTATLSSGYTASATYTTPIEHSLNAPDAEEHSFLGDPSEMVINELDGRVAVLSSKSRPGRGELHLTELLAE